MDLATYFKSPGAMTVAELATAAGIKHVAQINQWRNPAFGRRPGYEHAAAVERATKGACTCEELNSSLPWRRMPDREWPWHPEGKPLIDPLLAEAEQLAEEVSQ
ncbi:MAG: YdaS family helix-turn-helix protein [Aquabacterium sp.]|uniref:hypothetical protein n=1 Tax=Aquabacterium sp. TaxID=1872578 RepID=UPI003BAEC0CC